MKQLLQKLRSDRSGEITIETMLVMFPVIFVLIFLLSLGFLLYQHWNMQIAVDDTVGKIAGSYSLLKADEKTGEISLENYNKVEMYRGTDFPVVGKKTLYANKNRGRATEYVAYRMAKTSFATAEGSPVIECKVESDAYARKHIVLKVTAKYRIPFCEGLELFGMSGTREYTASASAECMDMLDYVNAVNVADVAPGYVKSKTLDAIDSWMEVIVNILNFGKD